MKAVSARAKKTSKALRYVALVVGIGALVVGLMVGVGLLARMGGWPGGPLPSHPLLPNEGALEVLAYFNGTYVVARVTVSNSSNSFSAFTDTDPYEALWFALDAGSYTVSGSYSSGSATPRNVTVVAGETVSVKLSFRRLLQPNEGGLEVLAKHDGAYIVALVTVSNSSYSFSGYTSTDLYDPLWFPMTAGSYTVSGSYSPGSATPQNVTVVAGRTVIVTLSF